MTNTTKTTNKQTNKHNNNNNKEKKHIHTNKATKLTTKTIES